MLERILIRMDEEDEANLRNLVVLCSGLPLASNYKEAPLMGIACETSLPPLLRVCRESRFVVAKYYKPTFACPHSNPETFFDFENDTLYLDWDNFVLYQMKPATSEHDFQLGVWNGFRAEDRGDLERVKRIAIRFSSNLPYGLAGNIATILRIFRRVETLSIIVHHFRNEELAVEDDSRLCMIDPIDVDKAIEIYKGFDVEEEYGRVHGVVENMRMPDIPWIPGPEMVRGTLEAWQDHDGSWELPHVQRKAMASPETRMALEELENKCWTAVEEVKNDRRNVGR